MGLRLIILYTLWSSLGEVELISDNMVGAIACEWGAVHFVSGRGS
jgi:hypothetical protein